MKLKGIDYLNIVAKIYDVPNNKLRANIMELSKKFKMDDVLNNKIESYSHGMRQKIVLIATMLHKPKYG